MLNSILAPAVLAASLASATFGQYSGGSGGVCPTEALASEMALSSGISAWRATGNPYVADRAATRAYQETIFVGNNWNPTYGWRRYCGAPVGRGYPGGGYYPPAPRPRGYNYNNFSWGVNVGVGGGFGIGYGGSFNNFGWGTNIGFGGNSGSVTPRW